MEYQIKRSKRKTMVLTVLPDGHVEVRAPLKTPAELIERFVRSKQDWIAEKQALSLQRLAQRDALLAGPVRQLRLLGTHWPADSRSNRQPAFDGRAFLLPPGTLRELQPGIIALYKQLAKGYILSRVQELSGHTGLTPTGVRITSAAGSWGSCSGKNALSFSWRLILAPPRAIDYVILHELCHTREHNHSPAFWALVAHFMPDWRTARSSLKALAEELRLEGW